MTIWGEELSSKSDEEFLIIAFWLIKRVVFPWIKHPRFTPGIVGFFDFSFPLTASPNAAGGSGKPIKALAEGLLFGIERLTIGPLKPKGIELEGMPEGVSLMSKR